ncbi:MAG: T9SS type A sorting domain-containing protein [Bacteroidota bacterium]
MQHAKYKSLLLPILLLLGIAQAYGQCADPDASIWENTWHSCEEATSPNPDRGEGHWVQYDFGQIYTLSTTHVWNANAADRLTEGFQEVVVDYSLDGEEWLTLDTVNFAQGTGQATYGGFTAFDFAGDSARYVLLTALSNYGHPSCYGLAEVKFNLTLNMSGDPGEGDDDDDDEECYAPTFSTAFVLNSEEVFILWEYIGGAEQITFRYREEGGEWVDVELEEEEPEVFLEGLEPETNYEYQVGIECPDDDLGYGQIFYFTTTAELEECEAPLVSNWIYFEDEDYLLISCNEVPDAEGYILRFRAEGSDDAWQEIQSEENFWGIDEFDGATIYEYQVSAICPDGNTEFSELFILNIDDLVDTQDLIAVADLRLFPNPTRDVVNLAVTTPDSGQLDIRIFNLMGQLVLREVHQVSSGRQGLVLPTRKLSSGVYTVNVYQEGSGPLGVHKLIVAK